MYIYIYICKQNYITKCIFLVRMKFRIQWTNIWWFGGHTSQLIHHVNDIGMQNWYDPCIDMIVISCFEQGDVNYSFTINRLTIAHSYLILQVYPKKKINDIYKFQLTYMIYKHLWHTFMIQIFLYMIRYILHII